jgi:L-alanine-DL-glutamate epimerase-like enolase superfamily enzyme
MARDMSDLGAYWWEEPVWPPENYRGLARLRKEGYRTAAGENAGTYYDFVAMVDAGAIDVAQPDVSKVGGLTDTRAIAQLCDANGLQIVPHAAIFGPGLLATVHFNASRYDTPFVERLYFDFEAELFGDALVPVNGRVAVPTNPGLGHDPNEEVIAEYRLD